MTLETLWGIIVIAIIFLVVVAVDRFEKWATAEPKKKRKTKQKTSRKKPKPKKKSKNKKGGP